MSVLLYILTSSRYQRLSLGGRQLDNGLSAQLSSRCSVGKRRFRVPTRLFDGCEHDNELISLRFSWLSGDNQISRVADLDEAVRVVDTVVRVVRRLYLTNFSYNSFNDYQLFFITYWRSYQYLLIKLPYPG